MKFFSNKMLLKNLLLLTCLIVSICSGICQTEDSEKAQIDQTAREELHRYMGYEELLPKYLSLPYDVSMNTNIEGPFVDIGFLLLVFIPIVIFLGLKNTYLKVTTGILLTVVLIVSTSTGYKAKHLISIEKVEENLAKELTEHSFSEAPLSYLKLKSTQFIHTFYKPIQKHIIDNFSAEVDAISYPLVLGLFVLLFFVISDRTQARTTGEQAIIYFLLLYGFLWWILGAGVLWYGLLFLPMGVIMLGASILGRPSGITFTKTSFLLGIFVWLSIALTWRFSNYNQYNTNPENNLGAIHAGPLLYGMGLKSEQELFDFLYPGYTPVIKEINNNPEALVYRIGTYFQYFIDKNNDRVWEDNLLTYFAGLRRGYPDNKDLVEHMKRLGYGYIIIDLNAASIDYTPDGTLKAKVQQLLGFINNNPNLQLVGTDRIMLNAQGQRVYSIYGKELVERGTFIAFKLK